MSTTVDQRVVEMRFDNKQFESGVKQSIDSTERLKKSLNFDETSKSLENVSRAAKNVDMSSLNHNLESVQARFSALQVVGTTALVNLTNAAISAGKKIANALTSAITQGGWNRAMNIEQAKFQLEGLGYAWNDVAEDIDYAVKGTAYGLDAAAKACSQLVASNVKIGKDMRTALRGISGVAAMTNSSYEEISHVFTRVAGNGRVMAVDLQSIASRGLNAAAALGKHLGKSESAIRELVSDGAIDFKTFAAAMDSAFGEHAKDANKTFTGAMSNMKAALSRIGADVASPALINLRDIFNALRVNIDDTHKALKPFIEIINNLQTSVSKAVVKFVELGGLKKILSGIANIFKGLWSIAEPIKDAFLDIFPMQTVEQLVEIVKQFADLTAKFKLNEQQASNLRSTFKGLFAFIDIIVIAVKALIGGAKKLLGNFKGLGSGILKATASFGEFLVSLRNGIDETNIFSKIVQAVTDIFEKVINVFKKLKDHLAEKLNLTGINDFGDLLERIWGFIGKVTTKVGEFGKMLADNFSSEKAQGALGLAGAILIIRQACLSWINVSAPIQRLVEIFKAILNGSKDFLGIGSSIKGAFSALNSSLWNLNRSIKYELLMNYAKALAILAISMVLLASIDSDKLGGVLGTVTVLMAEMALLMSFFDDMTSTSLRGGGLKGFFGGLSESILGIAKASETATTLIKMSVALFILASALKKLAELEWSDLLKGLFGVAALMGILLGTAKIMTKISDEIKMAAGKMITMGIALAILAGVLKIIAGMSWSELGRGLAGLAGIVIIITAAAKSMDSEYKKLTKFAGQIFGIALALVVLTGVLKTIASMSWEELGRGLLGMTAMMIIMVTSMKALNKLDKNMIFAAGSMLILAFSLKMLASSMETIGGMSWGTLAKSLLGVAAVLLIFGVAAKALTPVIETLFLLSGIMFLFGLGVLALGAGLVSISAGLASLAASLTAGAASLVAGLNILITGFIKLIPMIVVALVEGLKILVLALIDILVEAIPAIVDGLLLMIVGVLEGLVNNIPKIVGLIFDFLIKIIETLATKMPELIKAFVNLIMSIFGGVAEALKGIDPKVLLDGIKGVGILAALTAMLAVIAPLIPLAMIGVIGLGLVITEMAYMLASVSKLAKDPGLMWMISEGGYVLQAVGTAIGQFIGGLVGGFGIGVSSALPEIADNLSEFMNRLGGFIEGAGKFDSTVVTGVKNLGKVIAIITAADLIQAITSKWIGSSSLASFGAGMVEFGKSMKQYSDEITKDGGINHQAIESSTAVGKILADLAKSLPNSGGIWGWIAGNNDMGTFGKELVIFGESLKKYSDTITADNGIDSEAVKSSALAGQAVAELAKTLPDQGGIKTWFMGDNDMSTFGRELVKFGRSIRQYSDEITKDSGINAYAVVASASAGKALSELATNLPDQGGIKTWFMGDNDMSTFGRELVSFGKSMRKYSDEITKDGGINAYAIAASASVAKSLSQLATGLPDSGGIKSWFVGDNDMSTFGRELVSFGRSMKTYSDVITADGGVDSKAITASASIAGVIVEVAKTLPRIGGLKGILEGQNDLGTFGQQLYVFGTWLKEYSNAITADGGINAEAVTASANAAMTLANLAQAIPNINGIKHLFTGFNDFGTFSMGLEGLGKGIKAYSDAITSGDKPIDVAAVEASSKAALNIAQMTSYLSGEGGVVSWFTGSGSEATAKFAENLPKLGEGIKNFADAVVGIKVESIDAASGLAESIAKMLDVFPENSDYITDCGTNLMLLGLKLKNFYKYASDITKEAIGRAADAITAVKIAGTVDASNIESVATAIEKLTKAIVDMAGNIKDDLSIVGKQAIEAFVKSINDNLPTATTACVNVVTKCSDAMKDNVKAFYDAGRDLVFGFAQGITDHTYHAEAKSREMAKAAADAARKELDEHSPSKVGYEIGDFFGVAFVNGIGDNVKKAFSIGTELASYAKNGLNNAISKVRDVINSDLDTQPTIRPVLDLSDIKAGASAIGGIFGANTMVGVSSNINAISSMMNRNQNGGNSDIVSAIDKLRKDIGNVGGTTYQVNGVTYDDGSNVADAVKSLVRAVKIERRT